MSIVYMICFARSGGTVLNQCLGKLPNIVMMSEISPSGAGQGKGENHLQTIRDQSKVWYGIDLESEGFVSNVLELSEICKKQGQHLVIRDWPFIDFIPYLNNNFSPSCKFSGLEAIKKHCEVIPFCFVRDAIDVWISLSRKTPMDTGLFFRGYLRYVEALQKSGIRVFKYEDFVQDSGGVLREICEYVGLEFSESYKNYQSFTKVNGDVQFARRSRGRKSSSIRPFPRRRLSRKIIKKLDRCEEMRKANEFLGYSPSYLGVELESASSAFKDQCSRLVYRCHMGILRRLKR